MLPTLAMARSRALALCYLALLIAAGCHKNVDVHGTSSASPSGPVPQAATVTRGKNRDSITDMLGVDPGRCVEDVVVSGGCICFRLNRGGYWCRGARVFDEPPYRFIPRTYRKLFLDAPYCGLREDGRVECWGVNHKLTPYSDEKLIDSPDWVVKSPRPLTATPGPVEAFSSAGVNYCVLTEGRVVCPTFLGPEDAIEGLGQVRWLEAGPDIGCAANERQLWCWGYIVTPRFTFKKAVPVTLPAGVEIRELHFAGSSGCVVSSDSAAYCFGRGETGAWGDGQRENCIHECKGGLTGRFVAKLGHEVAQLVATGDGACALKTDGSVWCWGSNLSRLVAPTQSFVLENAVPLAVEPLPIQRRELGADNVELMGGSGFACTWKANGSLWCWGANGVGQVADTRNDFEPPHELPLPAPRCTEGRSR